MSAFSTVSGYGGGASQFFDPASGLNAALVDTADGYAVLYPQLNAGGNLTPFVINPLPIPPTNGLPEINALVAELRVISALLHMQLGATQLDLQQMRADEAYATTPSLNTVSAL